ncbi:MAG: CDP-diacylglycerol--serine O-phosphatidyltransferase [Rikenellaceae bacterium]
MKIRLFTIPNMLTLSNLLCGSIALIEVLLHQNFVAAFILIVAAAAFDFLDGLTARLLGQYSEIGRELDSLADVVSFGLVPAVVMYSLFNLAEKSFDHPLWIEWGAYIPLIIVCFSALRLARFNIDAEQQTSFIGLPTPANALFCLSLGLLTGCGKLELSAEVVATISIVMATLLIVPIRLFALKFSSFSWRENRVRYIFLVVSAVTLVLLRVFAIPVIIAIYILASVINNVTANKKHKGVINE